LRAQEFRQSLVAAGSSWHHGDMDHVMSDNELRTAIHEMRIRENEARKDGRDAEADEIAQRIRDYQQEMGSRK
jgi:hypothetical protein